MTPQPLLDAEFETVHEILERFGDKRAMNLEQLDGFLAAVLCGPDEVPLLIHASKVLECVAIYRFLKKFRSTGLPPPCLTYPAIISIAYRTASISMLPYFYDRARFAACTYIPLQSGRER